MSPWPRYSIHVHEDGTRDFYVDGEWVYSDPHPTWRQPFRRRQSLRYRSNRPLDMVLFDKAMAGAPRGTRL